MYVPGLVDDTNSPVLMSVISETLAHTEVWKVKEFGDDWFTHTFASQLKITYRLSQMI